MFKTNYLPSDRRIFFVLWFQRLQHTMHAISWLPVKSISSTTNNCNTCLTDGSMSVNVSECHLCVIRIISWVH